MTEQEWLLSNDPVTMLGPLESGYEDSPLLYAKVSGRKLRLFVCACVRLEWAALSDDRSRGGVRAAELFADGLLTSRGCEEAFRRAWEACDKKRPPMGEGLAEHWAWLASGPESALPNFLANNDLPGDRRRQAALLRCVVGNPFRPVALPYSSPKGVVNYRPGDPVILDANARCGWLTPLVLSLARAAYDERANRKCDQCGGAGQIVWESEEGGSPLLECIDCHGTGRIDDGTLDPLTLLAVADALEESGCAGKRVYHCQSDGKHDLHRHDGSAGQVIHGVLHEDDPRRYHHHHDEKCRCTDTPHPLLAHLRDPGPHVRGCWVIDLLLGKE